MTFRMDPRAKLYLLLLANLLLLFHVGTAAEAATTALCLLLFFLSGKIGMGLRLSALYFGLLVVDIFVVPRAGEGVLLNLLSLVSVGVRMMLPCIITGAYAFSTTTIGELTAALRRMHVPESVIIPCAVVVRFFPTVGEDYRHIRAAMALRGIAAGRGALLHCFCAVPESWQTLELTYHPDFAAGRSVTFTVHRNTDKAVLGMVPASPAEVGSVVDL